MTDAWLRLLCLMALTASFVGCVKEDMDDCANRYTLTVQVSAAEPNEAAPNPTDVGDVTLFIFDGEYGYLHAIETRVGETEEIDALAGENLHIVAWGNLRQGAQSYTDPQPGDLLDDCFVDLKPDTRATLPMLSPDDLFLGHLTLRADDPAREKVIPIYRQVGSMSVTVHKLREVAGYDDNDYHIVVRQTPSRIAFADGAYSGAAASCRPEGSFTLVGGKQVYKVPTFNLIPASGLEIDIFHGSQLVATVSQDGGGNDIDVLKGKTTQVNITLGAELGVTVSVDDWDDNTGEKEF